MRRVFLILELFKSKNSGSVGFIVGVEIWTRGCDVKNFNYKAYPNQQYLKKCQFRVSPPVKCSRSFASFLHL